MLFGFRYCVIWLIYNYTCITPQLISTMFERGGEVNDLQVAFCGFDLLTTGQHDWNLVGSISWGSNQTETFSALLVLCEWNSGRRWIPPTQRPVTRSFDVFFDLRLNKHLERNHKGNIRILTESHLNILLMSLNSLRPSDAYMRL